MLHIFVCRGTSKKLTEHKPEENLSKGIIQIKKIMTLQIQGQTKQNKNEILDNPNKNQH